MRIGRGDLEAIVAHARAGYPHEVCGVLLRDIGGPERCVSLALPVANRETERPGARFRIAPEDLLRIQREERGRGREILGYYHSHPDHPARPSETDRRTAAEGLSDGVLHVVVGVAGGGEAVATAWTFRDATRAFEPEPLEIE